MILPLPIRNTTFNLYSSGFLRKFKWVTTTTWKITKQNKKLKLNAREKINKTEREKIRFERSSQSSSFSFSFSKSEGTHNKQKRTVEKYGLRWGTRHRDICTHTHFTSFFLPVLFNVQTTTTFTTFAQKKRVASTIYEHTHLCSIYAFWDMKKKNQRKKFSLLF